MCDVLGGYSVEKIFLRLRVCLITLRAFRQCPSVIPNTVLTGTSSSILRSLIFNSESNKVSLLYKVTGHIGTEFTMSRCTCNSYADQMSIIRPALEIVCSFFIKLVFNQKEHPSVKLLLFHSFS